MKKFLLLLILNFQFSIINSSAQSPNWLWAKGMGGTGSDYGTSIAIDASGNVYTTGWFEGTVDFDPGAGVFNLTSVGGWDIFISKLDSSGNFGWVKAMGGTYEDAGTSIAIDLAGNGDVYTTGRFVGTVDFDPDTSVGNVFNLTSVGYKDIFISKLDSSGNFVWAKAMGGTDQDYGQSIAIDPTGSGAVYITGGFQGTVDFDPGAGVFPLTSVVGLDIFIFRLDGSGNFVWAKAMGGTGEDYGLFIAIDTAGSRDVYTTGYFYATVDFDPGVGAFNLTSAGDYDIFISKLDSSGNFVWAKTMGGIDGDVGGSIAIDPTGSGDVYTTGCFHDIVDFDPGVGIFNLTSAGGFDIFICKLDGSGNFVWAKAMGGTGLDRSQFIAIDPANGNVYTTGTFTGTVDFDPGAGLLPLTSAGSLDIFISRLDSSGNFDWAKAIGGTFGDNGLSIALDAYGHVHVTGYFYSPSITFGSTTLTNAGDYDIFIARLDTLANITGNNEIEILGKDILLSPNPLSNSTTISFSLIQSQKISLKIFDVNGRLVSTLTDKIFEAGKYELVWDAVDMNAGIYFLRMETASYSENWKLIVTK